MFDQVNDLYQKIILEHNKIPRNFRVLQDASRAGEGNNPMCGDRFSVSLKLEDDMIVDIGFQGSGCAVSKASASLMTETVKEKSIVEARRLSAEFQTMLKTGQIGGETLGDLRVFAAVQRFPMRVKCAVLPWLALEACIKDDER